MALLPRQATKNGVLLRRTATPVILAVEPSRGWYRDPQWVRLEGHGFEPSADLSCLFVSQRWRMVVTGEGVAYVSPTVIMCRQPVMPPLFSVPSYIEASVDGQVSKAHPKMETGSKRAFKGPWLVAGYRFGDQLWATGEQPPPASYRSADIVACLCVWTLKPQHGPVPRPSSHWQAALALPRRANCLQMLRTIDVQPAGFLSPLHRHQHHDNNSSGNSSNSACDQRGLVRGGWQSNCMCHFPLYRPPLQQM